MKFTDKVQYLRYLVDKRGMRPVYLILGLTYDCNSFCRTCFNWEQLRKNKEHELSFEELQKTFATLGDLLFVVMSGGEPFLGRDFPEISFHSFEMLRGDQPDKNIQPITTQRYRELLPKLEAYWTSFAHYDSFLKFVKIYTRRMELAILEQETQVRPCHAGLISGVLDARGEVRMCELRDAVGNVRDTGYDFAKLWFGEEADRQRASIKAKECHCTHSCFMSSSLVFDLRTWGSYFASTVVNFLSAA